MMVVILLQKMIHDKKVSRSEKQRQQFKRWLKEALLNEQLWKNEKKSPFSYPKKLVVSCLEDFDRLFSDKNWIALKQHLVENQLLPWARKKSSDPRWEHRNLAVRLFLLFPLQQDIPYLTLLLHDPNFYIRMIGCEAMGRLTMIETVPLLIKQMAKEEPTARFMFRHVLNQMPSEFLPAILSLFDEAANEQIQICCLDLLTHRFYGNFYSFLETHLQDPRPIIRSMIAALLANVQSKEAIQDLIELLHDSDPIVRKAAAISLGKIHHEDGFIPLSEALNDENGEVRIEAAFALFNYGKKGVDLLERQDSDLNPNAHEVARCVLTLP